jgi:hypothetical protein
MKNGKLQCKDIPTLPILKYVAEHGGIGCTWFDPETWNRTVRHAMPPGIPEKLILAKMRNLISKGLVDGCSCGCRGDFEITEKGQARILQIEGGVLPDCGAMWPERWTREAIEAKREELRNDPIAFANMFMLEPMPELQPEHMVDILRSGKPLELDLAAARDRERHNARTQRIIDEITVLALSGTDASGVKFVCSSEAQAKRVMEALRRRFELLGIDPPTVEQKTS